MSENSSSNTLTFVSIVVLAVVVTGVSLVARDRTVHNRSDAQIIQAQAAKTPEPELAEDPENYSFAGASIDPGLHANFQRVTMSLQPQINACLRKWPGHPSKTLVFVETDSAGRLTRLNVQNAAPSVSRCLLLGLSRGQFTRRSSGVAELHLSHERKRDSWEYR